MPDFTHDGPPCSHETAMRILIAYQALASDNALLVLANSAMAAHGVISADLSADSIAGQVCSERNGASLARSLERLKEVTRRSA